MTDDPCLGPPGAPLPERVPPDLLAWARRTFDEEKYVAEMDELLQQGKVRFEDFIGEVEKRARP